MSEDKNNQILPHQIDWSDQSDTLQATKTKQVLQTQPKSKYKQPSIITDQDTISLLYQQWKNCQLETFSMAEFAFQSGFNFLMTCLQFERFLQTEKKSTLKKLYFTVFENKPIHKSELEVTLRHYNDSNLFPEIQTVLTNLLIQYPLSIPGCHRLHFGSITLDLWIGDINESLNEMYIYQNGLFDCLIINESFDVNTFHSLKTPLSLATKDNALIATHHNFEDITDGLSEASFHFHAPSKSEQSIFLASFKKPTMQTPVSNKYGQYFRSGKTGNSKDIAIIGGGISSACLSLALLNRGYKVTLYCKDSQVGTGASGNLQGALYPLLNKQHDALSELFANSFLYTRQYVASINQDFPFDYDFSGLLQLYYDESAGKKLDKILQANLPKTLVEKIPASQTDTLANLSIGQCALHYPLAGWLSPTQMVEAIFKKAQQSGQLTIKLNHHLKTFEETQSGWRCHFAKQSITHPLLALTTAMHTLNFRQSEALPLSAARGQVTHIETTTELQNLTMTLCHEGYLTPLNKGFHCMGATFVRHSQSDEFSEQEQIDNKDKLAKCIKNKKWVDDIDEQHEHANVGIRCTTRDHFPYMGALPDYQKTKHLYQNADKKMPTENAPFYKNLFILTGLGSRGLNTAPLLAETLASQINHEPLPLSRSILNALQCNRQWVNYLKKGKKLKI